MLLHFPTASFKHLQPVDEFSSREKKCVCAVTPVRHDLFYVLYKHQEMIENNDRSNPRIGLV